MKTIVLEVDDVAANAYETLSSENKAQFISEATTNLKKMAADARSIKLKKIIEDIKNEGNIDGVSPDHLVELLRTEL
jgi:hypothetical protein